jgi:hypothetical protein
MHRNIDLIMVLIFSVYVFQIFQFLFFLEISKSGNAWFAMAGCAGLLFDVITILSHFPHVGS